MAVYIGLVINTELNGQEVEVVRVNPYPECRWPHYIVRRGDGDYRSVAETNLRKRRPPEEAGSWTYIAIVTNWNPIQQPEHFDLSDSV